MTVSHDDEAEQPGGALARSHELLSSVTRAHSLYFRDVEPTELFRRLLGDLLHLTGSEAGYIAEVLVDGAGDYLQTWAITDLSWDEASRELYRRHAEGGEPLQFRNLETLFGYGVRHRSVVIANDPADDPRAGSRPGGHPELASFCAIPIVRGDALVGQLAVAGRAGGYDEALVDYLAPFTSAVGNLIDAYRTDRERREAVAELARSKQWYEALVANLSDLVSVHDASGSVRFASPAAAKLLGRRPRPGTHFALHVHPDDVAATEAAFASVASGERGPDEVFEFRILDADGDYRTLQSVGKDLRSDPAIGGIVVTSRDVTDRVVAEQRLRETSSQLATLVSTLRDGVLFVDEQRRVVVANEAFCTVFGRPGDPGLLVGRPSSETRRFAEGLVADPEGFARRIDDCYDAGVAQVGEQLHFLDGRTLERDYLPIPLEDGRRAHLWLYRDVTERRVVDAQRLHMLQREREMRAATEQQNASLRELSELKDDFVAMVSHELRTPLTSVVGFTGLLLEEGESLNDEQREFLAAIDRNANRLLRLVGDLLLLARLEAGSQDLAVAALEPAPLVRSLVDSFRPEADERELELVCRLDGPPVVYADAGRIEQVLSNLISNALKFTPPGGRVEVALAHEGDTWSVTVADDGIGIPNEEQGQLFQRFYRSSNARAAATPGTGLGLVICRAIVELHGGTVELESEAGRGTTVVVRLPIEHAAAR